MKADQIQKIIEQENERIEGEVIGEARDIIRAIVGEQEKIERSNQVISDLREQLQKVTAETIDPSKILG